MRRSNNILIIGVAVFTVGALLAFFGLKSSSKPVAKPQSAPITAATPAGEVRTVVSNPAVPTGATTFTLPKGKQAVAIQLPSVAGLAGYARPGDTVNLYATIRNEQPNGKLKEPLVKLVLSGVKVLDVRGPVVGSDGPSTYLLALNVDEAEHVIFFAKYEALWVALTSPTQGPVSSVGRSYQNIL